MEESIRLVSSGDDIKIWNSSSMTVVDQFNPHATTHPVSRVCWSSNNHFLVSACASGDKIVVSSCKSSPVPVLDLAEGKRQTCVNLNSTSQFIVSGGLDNTVNIWDLKSKKLHRSLKDHKDVVTCVSFNGNDSYIASGSTSGEIILHSITTNLSSTPFGHGSTQPIQDLKYSSVKKSLMGSVSDSGTVVLWDANTQKPQHTFESAHKAPACGLCFSPANELLFVTVGLDKRIICYDTSSKKVLRGMVAESPLTAIDFMPDGAVLAVGSSRGKIYLYDLRMLTSPVKTVSAHKTSVQCLKFQHSPSQTKSSSKTSASKSSTTLSASTYKRATVQSSTREALQKPAAPAAPAAQHTFGAPAAGERGDGRQDNSAEMPRSTSLDVFPSKETDSLKSINHLPSLEKFDNVGRNSLSDVLSPVRDDYTTQKGGGDCSKGDGLDFLSQFTSGLPARRAPLGTPGVQTSPFNMFGDSPQPVREEEEEPKRGRAQLGLQDTKLISKGSSSATEPASMNTTGMLGSFKSPDMRGKDVQTKLQYESPVNGALPSVPILSPSPGVSAAGVASSLSERIADTIGSDGSSAPLTSIQIHFIRNMIQETLEDFRESCHRDIVNLQVEMIRQFYIQLNEIHSLIERYSVTDVLVAEIEKLKEENKKLRTNF